MEEELMTQKGYDRLLEKKKKLEQEIDEAGKAAGEAAGIDCDWHDNPAYDQAIEKMRMLSTQLNDLNEVIRKAKIISDNDVAENVVAVGTTVVIDFDGEEETYFIGGSADSDPSQGIISYKTPLAQAILNAKVGETRTYKARAGSFRVKILKIERRTE